MDAEGLALHSTDQYERVLVDLDKSNFLTLQ